MNDLLCLSSKSINWSTQHNKRCVYSKHPTPEYAFIRRPYLLNWMKTRFQISRTLGSSIFTRWAASLPPIRSKWISLQGPQGPVSPISQKLSFMLPGRMRASSILKDAHMSREKINQEVKNEVIMGLVQSVKTLLLKNHSRNKRMISFQMILTGFVEFHILIPSEGRFDRHSASYKFFLQLLNPTTGLCWRLAKPCWH